MPASRKPADVIQKSKGAGNRSRLDYREQRVLGRREITSADDERVCWMAKNDSRGSAI